MNLFINKRKAKKIFF